MVNTEGTLNLARQAAQAASRPAAARLPSSRQFQNTHRQRRQPRRPAHGFHPGLTELFERIYKSSVFVVIPANTLKGTRTGVQKNS